MYVVSQPQGRSYSILAKIISFAMGDIDYGLKKFCLFTRVVFSSASMNFSYIPFVSKPFALSISEDSER